MRAGRLRRDGSDFWKPIVHRLLKNQLRKPAINVDFRGDYASRLRDPSEVFHPPLFFAADKGSSPGRGRESLAQLDSAHSKRLPRQRFPTPERGAATQPRESALRQVANVVPRDPPMSARGVRNLWRIPLRDCRAI